MHKPRQILFVPETRQQSTRSAFGTISLRKEIGKGSETGAAVPTTGGMADANPSGQGPVSGESAGFTSQMKFLLSKSLKLKMR